MNERYKVCHLRIFPAEKCYSSQLFYRVTFLGSSGWVFTGIDENRKEVDRCYRIALEFMGEHQRQSFRINFIALI